MPLHAVTRDLGASRVREFFVGLEPQAPPEPSCSKRTVYEEWRYVLGEFDLGFSEGAGFVSVGCPQILHEALYEIYHDRLVWLYQSAGPTLIEQVLQCEQLAKQLGTLTGRLIAAELVRPDLYYGIPDATPRLGRKHLETARDMLGFYLNSRIANRHRPQLTAQVENPCPLCP